MWKKVLLLIIILVLAAVGGVTVYLNNIDWNRHKDKISQQFSAATGKEVVFDGPVRFSLFPSPYLEAGDISIYNRTASGERVLLAKIQKLVSTLSIRSLISGSFNVERMSLVEPEIYVEAYSDGKLNWQSSSGSQQDFRIDNVEISLNSLTVEKAKMHFVNNDYNINSVLDNMNAEIIAQSLFGPYRIEGSYVKDNSPGGFAVSLGQFSDSFATSVNAVISHPQSESYVRFDGTVLLNNDAINGNLIFESQNPVNFFNTNFKNAEISEDYEHPLALSMELKTDKSQISLGNIVVKYGGSAGAGNILIPRTEQKIGDNGMERRRIDAVFNMTEFELEPAILLVRDFVKKYDRKENYVPEYDFDVIADLKALKTTYNGQVIRDFDLSVDFMNNTLKIQNLSATMPGEASAKISGEVFGVEKKMTYNFNLTSSMSDFGKFAKWLKLGVEPFAQGTYKKASLSATVEGTTEMIKIAPFDLILDKSAVNGKIGIVRGDKTRWFVIADGDSVNFDNYVAALPADTAGKDWRERLRYRFGKLTFLKDADLQFRTSLQSGIFEKIPFEDLAMEATVKDGVLKIDDLSVKSVASGDFTFKGEVSGFGQAPQVKNLRYQADIRDTIAFLSKFGIKIADVNFNELSSFSASGVVTGGLERAATKSVLRLGDIDAAYHGEVSYRNNTYYLNGKTEVRAPSFVKMLNNFAVDYSPDYPLGLFKMSAAVKTSGSVALFNQLNVNVGANSFAGSLAYQKKDGRHQVKTDLKLNRFEFEKFFYNVNQKDDKTNFRNSAETATFIVKPRLSQTHIGYDWLKDWDVNAFLTADALLLNNFSVTKATGRLTLNKGVLKLNDFVGEHAKGVISGEAELNIPQGAGLSGRADVKGVVIGRNGWSGSVYGLTGGTLNANVVFNTSAVSVESLMTDLSGTIKFDIVKPTVKGWNFEKIEADLSKRDVSDGFAVVVRDALGQGETEFDSFAGGVTLNKGVYAIDNAHFAGSGVAIDMQADGSLKDWSNKALLKVTFDGAKVPGFDFSYDGSINTPVLSVDVGRATSVFDAHWAKLAAEAEAEEQARIEKYRRLMDEQQKKAHVAETELNDEVLPDFKLFSQMARDKGTRAEYQALKKEIDALNTLLEEIFVKDNMVNIGDEIVARLDEQNKKGVAQLRRIRTELERIHLKDVKLRINESYNVIFENYNTSKKVSAGSIDRLGGFEKRLAAINTSFYPKKDPSIVDWQKKIETGLLMIDQINSDIAKDNVALQNMKDTEQLERFYRKFDTARQNTVDQLAAMEKAAAEMAAYTEGKVAAEEKAYAKWLHDQEIKRKMQENTGQISTGGKTMRVERDLDDIQRAEEAVKGQKVRVLDFSDDSSNVVVPGREARGGRRGTDGGIILRSSDSGSSQSGGIIVKQ
jgi:conserved hypothetical protein